MCLLGVVSCAGADLVEVLCGAPLAPILAIGALGLLALALIPFALCTRNYNAAYHLYFWTELVLFPVIFWTDGGPQSAIALYFVTNAAFFFLYYRQRTLTVYRTLYLLALTVCYTYAFLNPEMYLDSGKTHPMYLINFWGCSIICILSLGVIISSQIKRLDSAKIEAEKATVAKSRFLATMSHEIRTPLHAMMGLAQIELASKDLPLHTAAKLETIYNSGEAQLHIINDILDIGKMEAGKLALVPEAYETASLYHDLVSLAYGRLGSKRLEFRPHLDPKAPCTLVGDPHRIRQVVSNLLSNAIKYTREGKVEFRMEWQDGNLVFTVKDTGIGIRAEDMAKLFTAYEQFDSKANREIEGTGLGLAITQKLVDLMDGSVEARSIYGQGSEFVARIPQESASEESVGADAGYRKSRFVTVSQYPGKKVLVVDDLPINVEVARALLNIRGVEVAACSSGADAVELARTGHFDAIFMDHMMPVMDGVEATRLIRAQGVEIPIVAMTANAVNGAEAELRAAGMTGFLSKPVEAEKLEACLKELWAE
jgi:signal transduction histidine kinase